MTQSWIDSLYTRALDTALLTAVTILIFSLIYFLLRAISSPAKRKVVRVRILYITIVIYALLVTKIWIVGLSRLLTALSLVGAAIVITNKESIMNIVGWLVISWRGLFSEGHYIDLQGKAGYVTKIGVLYFSLSENDPALHYRHPGKITKIPNNLVLSSPLVNYSQTASPYEYSIQIKSRFRRNYQQIEDRIKEAIRALLVEETDIYLHKYGDSKEQKSLKNLIVNSVRVLTKLAEDSADHDLVFQIHFKFLFESKKTIEEKVWHRILEIVCVKEESAG